MPCAPSPRVSPSPLHPFLRPIRTHSPHSVHLSFIDRSAHLRISQDGLVCSTAGGFRSVRGSCAVREGAWYCEFTIDLGGGDHLPPGSVGGGGDALDGAHVRLGWGRREAGLNGPVGLDGYSYGLRDKTGEKVTLSRPSNYLGGGFGTGAVIGLYISIPELPPQPPLLPPLMPLAGGSSNDDGKKLYPPFSSIVRHRIPIRFKGQLYFESINPPVTKEMERLMDPPPPTPAAATGMSSSSARPSKPTITNKTLPTLDAMRPARDLHSNPLRPLPILSGSKIAFFINGRSPGIAFHNLLDFRPLVDVPSSTGTGKKSRPVTSGSALRHKDAVADDGFLGYHPMISLYGGARATFNPGTSPFVYPPPAEIDEYLTSTDPEKHLSPRFFPPKGDVAAAAAAAAKQTWRPLVERQPEVEREQTLLDERDEQSFMENWQPAPPPKKRPAPPPPAPLPSHQQPASPRAGSVDAGSAGGSPSPSESRRASFSSSSSAHQQHQPQKKSRLGQGPSSLEEEQAISQARPHQYQQQQSQAPPPPPDASTAVMARAVSALERALALPPALMPLESMGKPQQENQTGWGGFGGGEFGGSAFSASQSYSLQPQGGFDPLLGLPLDVSALKTSGAGAQPSFRLPAAAAPQGEEVSGGMEGNEDATGEPDEDGAMDTEG